MKNKKLRVFLLVLAAVIALLAAQITVIALATDYSSSDVFKSTKGVFVEERYSISGLDGYNLTGKLNNSYAVLANKTAGESSIKFDVTDKVSGTFKLVFADASGEEFTVNAASNGLTLNVSVIVGGKQAGIYYDNGTRTAASDEKNQIGTYTPMSLSDSMYLRFDPSAMEVYIGDDDNELLVWDMSEEENDGRNIGVCLGAFTEYSVQLQFPSASDSFVLTVYSFGEEQFASFKMGNGAPSIGANVYSDAVVNKEYTIPTPYAYDFYEGEISDIYVNVMRGSSVILANQLYSDGLSFTPASSGAYSITYTASDSSGNTKELVKTVSAKSVLSDSEFGLSYDILNDSFGVGSTLALPKVEYSGGVAISAVPCTLTVKKDGEAVASLNKVSEVWTLNYTFDEAGVYEFIYSPVDENISDTEVMTFTVVDTLPSITYTLNDLELGDTLEVFDKSFKLGTTEGEYTVTAVTSDGRSYDMNRGFDVEEAGKYTVKYIANIDGNELSYSFEYYVYDNVYSIDEGGSLYYGESTYVDGEYGLNITLTEKSVFKYNKVIDLSTTEGIHTLIDLYATPKTVGTAEVTEFSVILTDVYDPTNYVTYNFIHNDGPGGEIYTYVRLAASCGQQLSGYENYGNAKQRLHVGDPWGTMFVSSLYGTPYSGTQSSRSMTLQMDYAERKGYIRNSFICDMDDNACYSNLWDGFTTGEVYLTVKGEAFNSEEAHFFIKSINGETVEPQGSLGNAEQIVFDVDFGEYTEDTLPTAKVGAAYKIFDASAFDFRNGNINVSAKVVYNYGQAGYLNVELTDGAFTPSVTGEYSIVYYATDAFGKEHCEVITVNAVSEIDELTVSVDSVNTEVTVGTAYASNAVPSFTGGSGKTHYKLLVEINGEYKEIEDGKWIPTVSGNYNAKFVGTDYIGTTVEYTFVIKAEYSEKPIFDIYNVLPTALISGNPYTLPTASAKYYAAGIEGEACQMEFTLVDGNGSNVITAASFSPTVASSGDKIYLHIKATYGSVSETLTYEYPVHIAKDSNNKYDVTKLFYSEDAAITVDSDALTISADNDVSVEFLNELLASGFSLTFNVDITANSFDTVNLRLFDAVDPSESVLITIRKVAGSKSIIQINGGRELYMDGSFDGSSEYQFIITYNSTTNSINDANALSAAISEYENGTAFTGFSSGKVRFNIELSDVSGSSALILYKVNSQVMKTNLTDRVSPQGSTTTPYNKIVELGTTIDVKELICCDVLDGNVTVSYSVKGADGEIMTSVSGTKLSNIPMSELHSFVCSGYGAYIVTYYTADSNGNYGDTQYQIYVIDTVAPEITVSEAVPTSGSVGSRITLPEATVSDNISGSLNYAILIYAPDGFRSYISGTEFVPAESGKYTVKYVALDKEGNMSVKTFELIVK